MPDFSAIALTRLKAEPSEEQIGRAVADLATRQRELVAVEEPRPAVTGDFLTIDFTGKVDGTVFPGGTGTDMDVEVGGPGFIPGFTEQMEGLSPGDSRTIEVSFPEGYGVADLAGKPAAFDVTAKLLKRAVVPAADDELAKKIGFEGLDDLKVALTGRFQRELDQLARLRIKRQLLDALAGAATFAVPQAMVEAERKEGRVDADDAGKDDETLRTEYRAIAERRVRLGLLLSEIGRVNGITVAPDEMTRAMRAEAARYPGQEKQVLEFFRKNPQASETLRGPIFEEKVVDFVLELARVTDSTVTAEELARDPDAPPDAPVAPDQVAAVPAIPEQPVPEQAVHEQAIVGQSAEEP
jgi:trigger factor